MGQNNPRAPSEQGPEQTKGQVRTEPRKGQPAQDWGQRVTEGEAVARGGKAGGQVPNQQAHKEAEGK
jgi:hypothetical protein